jgi:hypothetical protein
VNPITFNLEKRARQKGEPKMEFGKLARVIEWENGLTDQIAEMIEDKAHPLECRKTLDSCFEKVKGLDLGLALEIDGAIGELMSHYIDIPLTVGFILGSEFKVTDQEALKEIAFIRKRLERIIPMWPKEKKTPAEPGGGAGASK